MNKYFTTASGKQIEIQAVPMLLLEEVRLKAMETVTVPPVPTYQVELSDGEFVPYAHDEKSVLDPKTSDEEREAWRVYKEALAHRQNVSANKVMELLIAKGVKLEEQIDKLGEWAELQRYFGIELPENPISLRIHFIKTEILTGPEDINGLISEVMAASGIDPNLLNAARSSFRNKLREKQDAFVRANGADTEGPEGQVDDQQSVPGAGSGEGMGIDT